MNSSFAPPGPRRRNQEAIQRSEPAPGEESDHLLSPFDGAALSGECRKRKLCEVYYLLREWVGYVDPN